MLDPVREQVAFIDLLSGVREYFSLTDIATYLGSKPQNIAGWVSSKSVPHLRDFRPRLLEIAFFIRHIKNLPFNSSKSALILCDSNPPVLAPWGRQANAPEQPLEDAGLGAMASALASSFISQLMSLGQESKGQRRLPVLTLAKIAQLQNLLAAEKRTRGRSRDKNPASGNLAEQAGAELGGAVTIVWGETSAGKSTLINAITGAAVAAPSPIPLPPEIRIHGEARRLLIEAPGYDSPGPIYEQCLDLLKILFSDNQVRLLVVLNGSAFPSVSRSLFLEAVAQLPVASTLVFSKMDLHTPGPDHDKVTHYLRQQYPGFKTVMTCLTRLDERELSHLREQAGLVGSDRFSFLASLGHDKPGPQKTNAEILARILDLLAPHVADQKIPSRLGPDSLLSELSLKEAQLGRLLLDIEKDFGIKISDRDADHLLAGQVSLGWLAELVRRLSSRLST